MDFVEIITQLENLYLNFGYLITFVGSFLEATPLAWVLPGGIFVAAGGFYAYDGNLSLVGILLAGFLGELISLGVAYLLGMKKIGLKKYLNQEKISRQADLIFHKQGPFILTTSMLSGLTRFWVAYFAGFHRFSKRKFFAYSAIASFTWTSVTILIGYVAGTGRGNIEKGLKTLGTIGWIIPIIIIALIIWKIRKDYKQIREVEST